MNSNELMKEYLRMRGKKILNEATKVYKHDVYTTDAMNEAEIQQRVDALDIQDLDETVKDTGEDIKNEPKADGDKEPKDEPKADDNSDGGSEEKFPQDLGHGVTLLSIDNSNDYKG